MLEIFTFGALRCHIEIKYLRSPAGGYRQVLPVDCFREPNLLAIFTKVLGMWLGCLCTHGSSPPIKCIPVVTSMYAMMNRITWLECVPGDPRPRAIVNGDCFKPIVFLGVVCL